MMKLFKIFAIAAAITMALLASPAMAQASQSPTINWAPVGIASLSVSTSSANVAMPSIGPSALICNKGSADVYLAFGTNNTVAATTSGFWLKASKCQVYALRPFGTLFTYLAAITASSTATLYIETGLGTPLPLE